VSRRFRLDRGSGHTLREVDSMAERCDLACGELESVIELVFAQFHPADARGPDVKCADRRDRVLSAWL